MPGSILIVENKRHYRKQERESEYNRKKDEKRRPRPGFEPGTCYNHGVVMGLTRNNNHTSRPPRRLLKGQSFSRVINRTRPGWVWFDHTDGPQLPRRSGLFFAGLKMGHVFLNQSLPPRRNIREVEKIRRPVIYRESIGVRKEEEKKVYFNDRHDGSIEEKSDGRSGHRLVPNSGFLSF